MCSVDYFSNTQLSRKLYASNNVMPHVHIRFMWSSIKFGNRRDSSRKIINMINVADRFYDNWCSRVWFDQYQNHGT
jgi:hypothetical protein